MDGAPEWIASAIQTLALADSAMRRLDESAAHQTLSRIANTFVSDAGRRWWWEVFKLPFVAKHFPAPMSSLAALPLLVPSSSVDVWFIAAEEDEWPVYETTPESAVAVLAECPLFEYYLVDRDLGWLLCETHHDMLFAIGDPVAARLTALDRSST